MRIWRACGLQLFVLGALWSSSFAAQRTGNKPSPSRRPVQTATAVKADLVAGSLNPSRTAAGDEILLKLNEDVKSNGKTVFKKGTTVRGVVRAVRQAASGSELRTLIQIEWVLPSPIMSDTTAVMATLQSVAYLSPTVTKPSAATMAREAAPAVSFSTPDSGSTPDSPRVSGRTNAALMSMPSIVLTDQRTTTTLETGFGIGSDEQIYRTGRGDMITPSGALQSVDLYSFLSNDTMIVSADPDFEIGTGARMQLLVGIERK